VAGKADKETIVVPCDRCEASVAGTVQGSYEVYAEEPGFSVRWSLLRCPSCASAVLVVQDDEDTSYGGGGERWGKPTRLYPDMDDRQLGSAVPSPIRAAFSEARACYKEAKAYTACAIMCRKVLEGVCESHGATSGSLAQRLKHLSDSGQIDKRLFEWTDAMRLVGNEAAHGVSTAVSREDANDLLDLAEAVAEYLYTVKEKFESFNKRQAAKKADSKP
jgi:hypothetical protein